MSLHPPSPSRSAGPPIASALAAGGTGTGPKLPGSLAPLSIFLYDGHCPFCTRSAQRLQRVVGASRLAIRSFQTPGVLDAFPGISHEACMQRVHLILPDGRAVRGAEAFARALGTVPVLGFIAFVYYVPLVRGTCEWLYALVARNRYRLFGRSVPCDPQGTCQRH